MTVKEIREFFEEYDENTEVKVYAGTENLPIVDVYEDEYGDIVVSPY